MFFLIAKFIFLFLFLFIYFSYLFIFFYLFFLLMSLRGKSVMAPDLMAFHHPGSEFPSAQACIPALKTENGMHIGAKTTSARYRPGEGHYRDVRYRCNIHNFRYIYWIQGLLNFSDVPWFFERRLWFVRWAGVWFASFRCAVDQHLLVGFESQIFGIVLVFCWLRLGAVLGVS